MSVVSTMMLGMCQIVLSVNGPVEQLATTQFGYLIAHAENAKEFVVLFRIELLHRDGKSSDYCGKPTYRVKPVGNVRCDLADLVLRLQNVTLGVE